MFLSKDEKALVLLWRIKKIRQLTLLGYYKSYAIGESKIKKIEKKLSKMGYDKDIKLFIDDAVLFD